MRGSESSATIIFFNILTPQVSFLITEQVLCLSLKAAIIMMWNHERFLARRQNG